MTSTTARTSLFSTYKELSKSGIVTLVLISVLGGFLLGQRFELPFSFPRMMLTLVGVLFLSSGSSALNQYQEREIDASMPRTAGRPIPSGRLAPRDALAFIIVTLSIGVTLLYWLDPKVCALGILAVISYNGFYTLWWKRHWAFAAVPGAIPGALPILMGYAAARGQIFTPGGIYLFLILFFWQMPHFWVLALRFQKDYAQGGFPTLPVAHGTGITVNHIVLWCLAYVGLAILGPLFLQVKAAYCIPTFLMSVKVLWELRKFVREPEGKKWLHFFLWVNFSLIVYLGAAVVDVWSSYWLPFLSTGR